MLLRAARRARLAPNIAPGLAEIGVFLPYSPLHQLLLDEFGGPLVATSGNVSGEPVLTDPRRKRRRGSPRWPTRSCTTIGRSYGPADDSVVRVIAGRAPAIRLGRGIAPLELELPRRAAASPCWPSAGT